MTETPPPAEETAPSEPSPGGAPGGPESERQTTPFLVLQFFIFPMSIVAVCVTVFVVFGLISAEGKTPRTYLAEVRAGGGMFNIKRWQAAFALANSLETHKDLGRSDPALVEEVIGLFEESGGDDPLIRRYLALALGRLHDPRAVPCLRKVLQEATPDSDSQTVIYAAWALGSLGDASAVPDLVKAGSSQDRGIRKTAVHALGVFATDDARSALVEALGDAAEDVRWNAAIALARRGDPAAARVLLEMMDRGHLARVEGVTGEQQEQAMLQAVAVAPALADPAVRGALLALRDKDSSLKVRESARAALEAHDK